VHEEDLKIRISARRALLHHVLIVIFCFGSTLAYKQQCLDVR
jgi:hypothetical protein